MKPSFQCQNFSRVDPVAISRYYEENMAPALLPSPQTVSVAGPYMTSHADYLSDLFNNPEEEIRRFKKIMADNNVQFDTLVGTGLSGALSVPMFARAVGCHFALVRKAGDGTHSLNNVEGIIGRRWVFVDDLVCSGGTRRRVREAMDTFCGDYSWSSEYVGDYLYFSRAFWKGGRP